MPIFLNARFALLFLVALPLAGGATVHPQGSAAFVMGAWGGFVFGGIPLFAIAWLLGLRSLGQLLRPLARLPILIGLTIALLYVAGVDMGRGVQALGAAAGLWWIKRGARIF
jgi:hypothetical protein